MGKSCHMKKQLYQSRSTDPTTPHLAPTMPRRLFLGLSIYSSLCQAGGDGGGCGSPSP